jgi:hypothetical protein
MKKMNVAFLFSMTILLTISSYGQESLNIKKPISEQDKLEIQKILRSFDPNSYSLEVKTEKGILKTGSVKGLANVRQRETIAPGNQKDSSVIPLVGFRGSAASTITNINIFQTRKFSKAQMSELDKLHQILNKYQ